MDMHRVVVDVRSPQNSGQTIEPEKAPEDVDLPEEDDDDFDMETEKWNMNHF